VTTPFVNEWTCAGEKRRKSERTVSAGIPLKRLYRLMLDPTGRVKKLSGSKARAKELSGRVNELSGRVNELSGRVKRLALLIDALLVPAIRSGDAKAIALLCQELTDRELGYLGSGRVAGLTRLFLETGHTELAEHLLFRYTQLRPDLLLYFLEALARLDAVGALTKPPLVEFCAHFRPPSSTLALECLSREYKSADDADRRNFQRYVISPLRALSERPGNLMDIRFSEEQRRALQAKIRSSLREERPLSLLRLGDGESYPYPNPAIEGIERTIFESDKDRFERDYLGRGTSSATDSLAATLAAEFRQAVARCDILGFPSVFRIIRNRGKPHERYGSRRNQRAFLRLLAALGHDIPMDGKVFTEERCHRIRGAIDEPFLLALAAQARSVVLVSCWPELQPKFPAGATLIAVTRSKATLYRNYSEVIERICELSGPGTLVLIGAGVPAKIMADRARQAGAVALDVGSLLDYMVGHKTRTVADVT
jgi:glycosyltransferase GT-like protein